MHDQQTIDCYLKSIYDITYMQVMIVLELLSNGDLQNFLIEMTPE